MYGENEVKLSNVKMNSTGNGEKKSIYGNWGLLIAGVAVAGVILAFLTTIY